MRYRVMVFHESVLCVVVEAVEGSDEAVLREAALQLADAGEAEFETVLGETDFYSIKEGEDDCRNHGCYIHDDHPTL